MQLTWRDNHPPGGNQQGWIAEFPGGVATIETGRDWRTAIDGPGTPGSFNDADLYLTIRRHEKKEEAQSAAFVRKRKPVGGDTVEAAMAAALEYLKRQAETVYLLDPDPRAESPPPAAARGPVVAVRVEEFTTAESAGAKLTELVLAGWELDGPLAVAVIDGGYKPQVLQRLVRRGDR